MHSEVLTNSLTDYPMYSTITLALLNDTGLYPYIDFTVGQTPIFGRNAGCSFFNTPCITKGVSNFPSLFCDKISIGCDYVHFSKAKCYFTQSKTPLYTYYQYFSRPYLGGADPYPDYCPYYKPLPNGSCRGDYINNQTDPITGEVTGPSSRCFVSSLTDANSCPIANNAACYQLINCNDTTGATVKVGAQFVICPLNGGFISVPGYNGNLTCPTYSVLCGDIPCPNGCYSAGRCIKGVCACFSGFSGVDCSEIAL